jgi:rRNA maturation endonuclease Nob1
MSASGNIRWWVPAVAVLVGALFLADYVGLAVTGGLVVLTVAVILGIRGYRSRYPAQRRGMRCIRCGATLPATARQCESCGSASVTYIN